MKNICEILYDYFDKEKIADEKFINICFDKLLNYFDIHDYVKNIKTENYSKNFVARYLPEEKTIYINYQTLVSSILYEIVDTPKKFFCEYKHRLFALNLMTLKVLLHEIEHVNQEKKKIEINNPETKILILSDKCETFLKSNKIALYTTKLYFVNPIERSAELSALNTIIQINNLFSEETIKEYLQNNYKSFCSYGYSNYNNKVESPLKKFIKEWNNVEEAKQLENLNYTNLPLEFRKLYGLNLSEKEYVKIHIKKEEKKYGGKNRY